MLRECSQDYGECTTRRFNDNDDFCSASLVIDRFGSWTKAKEKAGLGEDYSTESGGQTRYADEQILSHLRECRRRHGTCTTEKLLAEDDLVSPSVAVKRFGSWSEAKKRAGIDFDGRSFNSRPRKYSDEQLLDMVQDCYDKHGKVTQRVFDEDDDFPSSGTVRKRFGAWSQAKKLAGIERETRPYSTEDLLDMLGKCAEKYERCTARNFASDDEFCSPETVQRHFGSWNKAKKEAGII
jgi:transposase